jgi:4-hydroxy-2-oxoheptanedioate aldolase
MPLTSLPPNLFKRGLDERRHQPGLWLTLESAGSTEVVAGSGYDWLLLDMEHTTLGLSQVVEHIRAARGGTAEMMVRIPNNDPVLIKRILDAGVRTLMIPFVQSAAEARAAVAATRYPPKGIRGVSSNNRANNFARIAEYGKRYHEEQCLVVQVETPSAIDAISEIGEIDGVDGIFVGPNDLAANMGLFGQPGAPAVQDVIASALERIKGTGKAAGILNFNPAEARQLFIDGFRFIAVGSDTSLLARHSEALVAEFQTGLRV